MTDLHNWLSNEIVPSLKTDYGNPEARLSTALPFVTALFIIFALQHSQTAAAQSEPASFTAALSTAAIDRTTHSITYDGRYFSIPYPGGDVPGHIGVCTDVIIRSYRALGIDLQELVHTDMTRAFDAYPDFWALSRPDPNIDHRRVPNLQTFFSRNGSVLPITNNEADYKPGDLVTWMLPGNLPHIGIVVDQKVSGTARHLLVHNVGRGPKLEDVLFAYKITGHYRYSNEPAR